MIFLRKATLSVFAPVADLSVISRSGVEGHNSVDDGKRKRDVELMSGGAQVLGDEWADHVVKVSIGRTASRRLYVPQFTPSAFRIGAA